MALDKAMLSLCIFIKRGTCCPARGSKSNSFKKIYWILGFNWVENAYLKKIHHKPTFIQDNFILWNNQNLIRDNFFLSTTGRPLSFKKSQYNRHWLVWARTKGNKDVLINLVEFSGTQMKAVMETIPNKEVLIFSLMKFFLHSNEGRSIDSNGKVKKTNRWWGQAYPSG